METMRVLTILLVLFVSACGSDKSSRGEGEAVAFERLHCPAVGHNSIFDEPFQEVIRDQHRFTEVYLGVDDRLPSEVPDIDFNEKQVIAMVSGFRSSSGYAVDMGSIRRHADELRVRYLTERPGDNCGVATVITYPYCLVVTERTNPNLPVRFEEHESINHCE